MSASVCLRPVVMMASIHSVQARGASTIRDGYPSVENASRFSTLRGLGFVGRYSPQAVRQRLVRGHDPGIAPWRGEGRCARQTGEVVIQKRFPYCPQRVRIDEPFPESPKIPIGGRHLSFCERTHFVGCAEPRYPIGPGSGTTGTTRTCAGRSPGCVRVEHRRWRAARLSGW
ncbi:hypothetical protein D9M68_708820 [compost metagenome]